MSSESPPQLPQPESPVPQSREEDSSVKPLPEATLPEATLPEAASLGEQSPASQGSRPQSPEAGALVRHRRDSEGSSGSWSDGSEAQDWISDDDEGDQRDAKGDQRNGARFRLFGGKWIQLPGGSGPQAIISNGRQTVNFFYGNRASAPETGSAPRVIEDYSSGDEQGSELRSDEASSEDDDSRGDARTSPAATAVHLGHLTIGGVDTARGSQTEERDSNPATSEDIADPLQGESSTAARPSRAG